jgi:hypothetical protein
MVQYTAYIRASIGGGGSLNRDVFFGVGRLFKTFYVELSSFSLKSRPEAAGAALFFRAGTLVDDAMTAIERDNSSLKGVCGDSPHSRFGHPGRSCARHPRTR